MAASYCFVAICMPSIASLALSLDYFYQQPSPMLLRTYMITVCFADVAQIWNYQLSANNWVVSLLSLCTALVNATLLLSETYVKSPGSITSISTDFLREKSEDELSNRSLLERLRGLLGFGFRTWTTVDDLPQLADELSVATLSRDFEPIWASSKFSSCTFYIAALPGHTFAFGIFPCSIVANQPQQTSSHRLRFSRLSCARWVGRSLMLFHLGYFMSACRCT